MLLLNLTCVEKVKRSKNDRKSKESPAAFAEQPNVGGSVRRVGGLLRDQFVLVPTGDADRLRPWRCARRGALSAIVVDNSERVKLCFRSYPLRQARGGQRLDECIIRLSER